MQSFDSLAAFVIASVVTLFFVRRYLRVLVDDKRAASRPAAGSGAAVDTRPTFPCPRCSKPIPEGTSFCPSCGAPLALWNVHRAAVQEPSTLAPGERGKPRPVINASLCIACGSCVDDCPETGTLAIASGKAILANPERCTGHAKCVSACPTSAITLAFGNVLQTVKVPLVSENFETNVPGLFIVGELGGVGLIKTAINEGKLAIEHIRARLEAEGRWSPPVVEHNHDSDSGGGSDAPAGPKTAEPSDEPYDVLIAGAGPAGLSASLTAQQHGIRYITVEQGEIASTIRNYPRHKFLMAEPLEMPLYGNLYINDTTKEGLLSVWEAILSNPGVQVRTHSRVERIVRDGDVFRVTGAGYEVAARNIILALGKRGTPRRLGVDGEGLGKVAYRLIEAESYEDRDILIVGGGDSAIEAALAVSKGGRNRAFISYRGSDFQRLKDRNRKQLEDAESQGRICVYRNSTVSRIDPTTVTLQVDAQPVELPNDYVFVLIGGESPEEFLRKTGIEIVEKAITI